MHDLRESPLLSSCDDGLYGRITGESTTVDLPAGELLFDEDDIADGVWLLLEGELEITKRVEEDDVPVDHLAPGAYLGEISLLTHTPAGHRARASVHSRLARIPGGLFHELLRSCASTAQVVVTTLAERVRRIEAIMQKRERLAGLGRLAAGLAHELNNPAAAAKRASEELLELATEMPQLGAGLASRKWEAHELELLDQLSRQRECEAVPPPTDPLLRSEREEEISEWLDEHGVEDAWDMGPCFVDAGLGKKELEHLAEKFGDEAFGVAVPWLAGLWRSAQLVREVSESAGRISELVRAIKSYSKADATTAREIDVAEDIGTTLLILGHKMRAMRVETVKEFAPGLPRVQAYGTELYQIWTNIVDNAVDALDGRGGTVTIRTSRSGDGVLVEIEDDGPGIPEKSLDRIFDPFYTTKEAGKGTGLGLEIVKRIVARHHGRVDVTSRPGQTRFSIWLPERQRAKEVTP